MDEEDRAPFDEDTLENMCSWGGGRFYDVKVSPHVIEHFMRDLTLSELRAFLAAQFVRANGYPLKHRDFLWMVERMSGVTGAALSGAVERLSKRGILCLPGRCAYGHPTEETNQVQCEGGAGAGYDEYDHSTSDFDLVWLVKYAAAKLLGGEPEQLDVSWQAIEAIRLHLPPLKRVSLGEAMERPMGLLDTGVEVDLFDFVTMLLKGPLGEPFRKAFADQRKKAEEEAARNEPSLLTYSRQ